MRVLLRFRPGRAIDVPLFFITILALLVLMGRLMHRTGVALPIITAEIHAIFFGLARILRTRSVEATHDEVLVRHGTRSGVELRLPRVRVRSVVARRRGFFRGRVVAAVLDTGAEIPLLEGLRRDEADDAAGVLASALDLTQDHRHAE